VLSYYYFIFLQKFYANRSQAGHEREETTYKNYCFDRLADKYKEDLLERALSNQAK